MKKYEPSELIINEDNSIFHLHIKPEQLADRVILVGDPGRVDTVASHFDSKECEIQSREFHTMNIGHLRLSVSAPVAAFNPKHPWEPLLPA